ncbi:expressed unknown protein [Seminavis robusta]|uniref:Uncharacterized protein n=1 Tax=Seminavis robusta TaxID=568900 RepID=A0A9N8ED56_9STRA|nr:expressed unknown protein [Seminavis robusta]|eukprot:Sro1003_g229990.1 n/a (160) ;mRNA; r:11477-11956
MMRRDRELTIDTSISPQKDGGGLAFFMTDPEPVAPSRWSGRRGRRQRKKHGGGKTTTPDEKGYLGDFEEPLRRLSFTDKDLLEVIDDPEDFRLLQSDLRRQGAVTNSLIKEGIHFYVQNCLVAKKQSDSPTTMITPKSSTSSKKSRQRASSWSKTPPRS